MVTKSGLGQPPSGTLTAGLRQLQQPDGGLHVRIRERQGGQLRGRQRDEHQSLPRYAGSRGASRYGRSGRTSSIGWMRRPARRSTFHLDMRWGRSSFDVPNTLDANFTSASVSRPSLAPPVPPISTRTSRASMSRRGIRQVLSEQSAVDGQRLRARGSCDLFAERQPVRRPHGIGVAGSTADQRGRQGGSELRAGRSQSENRRADERDATDREVHARPDRSGRQFAVRPQRRQRIARSQHGADESRPMRRRGRHSPIPIRRM